MVLILIQKLRAISLYGEIDNVTMMLEIFSVCLTAGILISFLFCLFLLIYFPEELGPMPAILFVEHDCVPILLKLLTKHNTACTCAIFEILVHIVIEKGILLYLPLLSLVTFLLFFCYAELCHSIICPELNILFDDLEYAPEDVSDFFMELHVNSNLRSMILFYLSIYLTLFPSIHAYLIFEIDKLCLFLLENCQLPKMYGLIAKYPALEGFEEHLTAFLSENSTLSSLPFTPFLVRFQFLLILSSRFCEFEEICK